MSEAVKTKSKSVGKQFRIYKSKNDGNGAASSFQLSERDGQYGKTYMLFLEMAKQTKVAENDDDDAAFGWKDDSKVVMKLGPVDIAEMLMVVTGKKAKVGQDGSLFHKNSK